MNDNQSILREFIERVWNRGELEAVDTFVAPAYTIHSDPGDPWHGRTLDRSAFVRRLVESKAPFADLKFTLSEVVSEGERVAVSWVLTGTHTADLGELRATGNAIRVEGMTIYSFERGRLTGHRQVVDRLAVLQQLGALGG
jgi:steroid delta-isomerase-like uncharacterized protein